jgi:hypothetical protein
MCFKTFSCWLLKKLKKKKKKIKLFKTRQVDPYENECNKWCEKVALLSTKLLPSTSRVRCEIQPVAEFHPGTEGGEPWSPDSEKKKKKKKMPV